jgi:hypothetical protein
MGYEYKYGEIYFCDLTPGTMSDNAYTHTLHHHIHEGDLIIADLGYSSLNTFHTIQDNNAFFLSRFNLLINVYDPHTDEQIELEKLLPSLTDDVVAFPVHIGAEARLSCRMIARRVSPEEAEKRRRKLRKQAKKNGYQLRKRHYILAEWTIMITNIDETILPIEVVWFLYALRWQIELLFKQFKSVLHIHKSNTSKGNRLVCEIYGTLIVAVFIALTHATINSFWWNTGKREVSFNKLAKRIQERAFYILKLLFSSNHKTIDVLYEEIMKVIRNCTKGIQRGRKTSLEKLEHIVIKGKSYELACA